MKTTIQEQIVLGIQMKSLGLARARLLGDPSKHLHISDDGSQSIKKCKTLYKKKEKVLFLKDFLCLINNL